MAVVDTIKAPISAEMDAFEGRFRASMSSKVALLDKITHYIIKRKGKQMRPMFVFLSAKLLAHTNDATFRAAALIELLHTATLVHDDVVDDSYMRRGFFSINALWKNKIAVLVGDYLLSKGLLLAVDNRDFEQLQLVSDAVREMSEGELLQLEKARTLNIDEEIYYEIIRQKTATLIAACCACGVSSVGGTPEQVKKIRKFGELVGMAFQIKDDLFDYGDGEDIGKPTGIDIQEKKTTLPLIYALNNTDKKQRNYVINLVKNHNTNAKKVKEVVDFVMNSGGIVYARNKMNEFVAQAIAILHEFQDNEARQSLELLVQYTISRKK